MRDVPQRLTYLNTWSLVGGAVVWRGYGSFGGRRLRKNITGSGLWSLGDKPCLGRHNTCSCTSDREPSPDHRAGKFIGVPYRNVGEQKGLRYKPHPSTGTAHRSWKLEADHPACRQLSRLPCPPRGHHCSVPLPVSAASLLLLGQVFSTFLTP